MIVFDLLGVIVVCVRTLLKQSSLRSHTNTPIHFRIFLLTPIILKFDSATNSNFLILAHHQKVNSLYSLMTNILTIKFGGNRMKIRRGVDRKIGNFAKCTEWPQTKLKESGTTEPLHMSPVSYDTLYKVWMNRMKVRFIHTLSPSPKFLSVLLYA